MSSKIKAGIDKNQQNLPTSQSFLSPSFSTDLLAEDFGHRFKDKETVFMRLEDILLCNRFGVAKDLEVSYKTYCQSSHSQEHRRREICSQKSLVKGLLIYFIYLFISKYF